MVYHQAMHYSYHIGDYINTNAMQVTNVADSSNIPVKGDVHATQIYHIIHIPHYIIWNEIYIQI